MVVAGAPNVGKSSLVNALAGFQRSVVSEIAGTTRDVVSVQLAFDGWPVELTDTAGLREAEGLEAEGVARANRALAEADLVLWVWIGATRTRAGRPIMNWLGTFSSPIRPICRRGGAVRSAARWPCPPRRVWAWPS